MTLLWEVRLRWWEDYDETYAPVAKYTSIRTLFALIAGRKNSRTHQMDVNTAFLNSDIEETVYVEQPEGYEVLKSDELDENDNLIKRSKSTTYNQEWTLGWPS